MPKKGYTYIVSNKYHTVLYTGATRNLKERMDSHRNKKYKKSFSSRYNTGKLVWYQEFETISEALDKERRIKTGSRQKKTDLINEMNPGWEDLYEGL